MVKMSSPSRPQRKSRNVPPKRFMDDMVEYFPPVATSGDTEVKEEESVTEDVAPPSAKTKRVDTPEKQDSAGMVEEQPGVVGRRSGDGR